MECKVSTVKAAMNKYTHDSDQVLKTSSSSAPA